MQCVFGLKYQRAWQLVNDHDQAARAMAAERKMPLGDADCIVLTEKGHKHAEPLAGEP